MLIRGGKNRKIATLKRVPTKEEMASFDLSMYPTTMDALRDQKWKDLYDISIRNQPSWDGKNTQISPNKAKFQEMAQNIGIHGQQILTNIFQVSLL